MTTPHPQESNPGCLFSAGLFFLPPLAYPFLFLQKGYSRTSKILWGAWCGLWVSVQIAAVVNAPTPEERAAMAAQAAQERADRQAREAAAAAERAAAQRQADLDAMLPDDLTCRKVTEVLTSDRLTDLQKEELWPEFDGRIFKWDLEVRDVSKSVLNQAYQVSLLCPGSRSFTSDLTLWIPLELKDLAVQLESGKRYELTGRLDRYGEILGLSAQWVPDPTATDG